MFCSNRDKSASKALQKRIQLCLSDAVAAFTHSPEKDTGSAYLSTTLFIKLFGDSNPKHGAQILRCSVEEN